MVIEIQPINTVLSKTQEEQSTGYSQTLWMAQFQDVDKNSEWCEHNLYAKIRIRNLPKKND